ncbi:MAG: hypothetical protein U0903_15345 [Planctomycetales bacterium]
MNLHTKLSNMLGISTRRRVKKGSALVPGGRLESLETRDLLSAHVSSALAGEAGAHKKHPAAGPVANYAGTWNVTSDFGNGTATITQDGKATAATVSITGIGTFQGTGHVTGKGQLKSKQHVSVMGFDLTVKLTLTLNGPDAFTGTGKTKVPGVGPITAAFNGTRA